MTNKNEKIAEEMAGMRMPTDEEMDFLKHLHEQINNIHLCKNSQCKNIRANGSSRCKECSDKYANSTRS